MSINVFLKFIIKYYWIFFIFSIFFREINIFILEYVYVLNTNIIFK